MIELSLNFVINLEFTFICYLLLRLLQQLTSLKGSLLLFIAIVLIILKVSSMFINPMQFNFTVLNWMHYLQCSMTFSWFKLFHFSFHWRMIFAYFCYFVSWNALNEIDLLDLYCLQSNFCCSATERHQAAHSLF